jgi:aspartyl/asparaginyl beta-hydroxylase (cupin superfamily)
MVRQLIEKMIGGLTTDGKRTFFEPESLPWVARVEAEWMVIRAELDTLLAERDRIPNFQDVSADQSVLTEGTQWKTFFLYAYGRPVGPNCGRCPETTRLLQTIPGMKTAMFSILAPRKHVPEHRGPYKGVLRYHLGLLVPDGGVNSRIRVGSEVRHWQEGRSLVFDDSHLHEVWNVSDSTRVVLFVDFERPLFFPLSLLNRLMIRRISRTPFITTLLDRIRELDDTGRPAR